MKFSILILLTIFVSGCNSSNNHKKLDVDELIISSHSIWLSDGRTINYPYLQYADSLSQYIYDPVFTVKITSTNMEGYVKTDNSKSKGYFSTPMRDSLAQFVNYYLKKINYLDLDSIYRNSDSDLYDGPSYILIFRKGNIQKEVKVFNPKEAPIQIKAFVDNLKNYASALNLSDIINNSIIKIDSIMKKEHKYEPFSKTVIFLKAPRK